MCDPSPVGAWPKAGQKQEGGYRVRARSWIRRRARGAKHKDLPPLFSFLLSSGEAPFHVNGRLWRRPPPRASAPTHFFPTHAHEKPPAGHGDDRPCPLCPQKPPGGRKKVRSPRPPVRHFRKKKGDDACPFFFSLLLPGRGVDAYKGATVTCAGRRRWRPGTRGRGWPRAS